MNCECDWQTEGADETEKSFISSLRVSAAIIHDVTYLDHMRCSMNMKISDIIILELCNSDNAICAGMIQLCSKRKKEEIFRAFVLH